MTKHRCFEVTTPAGHTARIHGDPEMPQATLDALMQMMDLAYAQLSAIEMIGEVSDKGVSKMCRPAHNFLGVLCAVPTCGEKRSGGSRYCKKHDMRWRRHGDVSDRPRGRPRKTIDA